jgi:uncharacterized protein involved in exopolysaccharide biosynthesis
MAISTLPEQYDNEPSDLRYLFARLAERRIVLFIAIAVSTVLFVTFALVSSPVYRATTVLIPASIERNNMSGALNSALGQLGGLAALAGIGPGSGDLETEEALAVLRSRQFTERFIDELNLMPVLYSSRWDAKAKTWREDKGGAPSKATAYKYFNDIRKIIQDKKTGLISLQIDWTDRQQATTWANELAARLNAEMRSRAIRQVDASLSFLEKEQESTATVATRDDISRLIEAQIKQRMLANVTQEYAFRVVDRAIAPDADDPQRPKKLLLCLLGPCVGFALGVAGILVFELFFGKRSRIPG